MNPSQDLIDTLEPVWGRERLGDKKIDILLLTPNYREYPKSYT